MQSRAASLCSCPQCSCPSSFSTLWVWEQGAQWVVVKRGGGCEAQPALGFTAPPAQLPSAGADGIRVPTVLVTSQEAATVCQL